MQKLTIEYVLEGNHMEKGYNFTSPTNGVADEVVSAIWRGAMPRGKGWRDPALAGARSLKCIVLPGAKVAFSDVVVTAMRDEMGRGGIRRAEVTIISEHEYEDYLQQRWDALPDTARDAADEKLNFWLWKRLADKGLAKVKGDARIALIHPYHTSDSWQAVEAIVLKIMMANKRVRFFRGWGKINDFTTLALDFRDESHLVAIPQDKAADLKPNKQIAFINLD